MSCNCSVIKEEGECDEEDEDDKGDSPSRSRSGGSRSRSDAAEGEVMDETVGHAGDARGAERSNSDVAAGYSRLEREDPEQENCRSSCSSDLSFGASSSGNFF